MTRGRSSLEAQIKIQRPDSDLRMLAFESEVKENGTPGKGNVQGMRLVWLYGNREV
jgi:hypothetical protein